MNEQDPIVQITISIRQSQLNVANRKVAAGQAKNRSQCIGKALDYVNQHGVEFLEA